MPIIHYKRVKRPARAGDYIKASKGSQFVRARKYHLVTEFHNGDLVVRDGTDHIVKLYNGPRTPDSIKVYERVVK